MVCGEKTDDIEAEPAAADGEADMSKVGDVAPAAGQPARGQAEGTGTTADCIQRGCTLVQKVG